MKTNLAIVLMVVLSLGIMGACSAQTDGLIILFGDLNADAVLGQLNLTSGTSGSTATTLSGPNNSAVDPITGRIYVCDSLNNRVLGWPNAASFANADPADLVIGQVNFTANLANKGGAASSTSLSGPNAVVVDSVGNLYVSDGNNNRVLIYTNPSIFDTTADIVIGQPNFTTVTAATTQAGLKFPFGVHLDERGNLFVADSNNNRVVEYDFSYTSGENAVRVFGQLNFTTGVPNSGGIGAGTLNTPTGMDFDNAGNMYIADFGNNRVLEYDRNSTGFPDPVADRVFGQPNFVSFAPGTTATSFSLPEGVLCDINGNLYVADRSNNRVLIFNTPLTSATADRVIGQTSFTSATGGTSEAKLLGPKGVTADGKGNVYVTDSFNSRVLRYNFVLFDNAPFTQYTSKDTLLIPAATSFGEASPFPSILNVSNVTGVVTKVKVTLKHLSHTFPGDMDIYLIGPGGQGVKLMSDCGAGLDINNVSLVFDDSAGNLPSGSQITSGTYKPTDYEIDGPTLNALGTSLGVFNSVNPNGDWSLFVVDDVGGDEGQMFGWGLTIFTAPVIQSGLDVNPSTASVGQAVAFSAAITSSPGLTVTTTWDFGDSTTGSGASTTHTYAAPGNYTVTLTVNDGVAAPVTSTTSVLVVAALVGTGIDTDGDGFSDSFETIAGTDTGSATSTPAGGASASSVKLDLPDVKLSIALNFAKPNSDAIALAGTLLVPEGFTPVGKVVVVDIGGVTQAFTLTSSGSAIAGNNSIKIPIKGSASTAKFSVKLNKGAFAARLLDEGLVNATVGTTVHVKATLVFAGQVLIKNQTLSYKATAGKSGKAK